MGTIAHTMALEDQATSNDIIASQTRALANNLLKDPRRELWRQD